MGLSSSRIKLTQSCLELVLFLRIIEYRRHVDVTRPVQLRISTEFRNALFRPSVSDIGPPSCDGVGGSCEPACASLLPRPPLSSIRRRAARQQQHAVRRAGDVPLSRRGDGIYGGGGGGGIGERSAAAVDT